MVSGLESRIPGLTGAEKYTAARHVSRLSANIEIVYSRGSVQYFEGWGPKTAFILDIYWEGPTAAIALQHTARVIAERTITAINCRTNGGFFDNTSKPLSCIYLRISYAYNRGNSARLYH